MHSHSGNVPRPRLYVSPSPLGLHGLHLLEGQKDLLALRCEHGCADQRSGWLRLNSFFPSGSLTSPRWPIYVAPRVPDHGVAIRIMRAFYMNDDREGQVCAHRNLDMTRLRNQYYLS